MLTAIFVSRLEEARVVVARRGRAAADGFASVSLRGRSAVLPFESAAGFRGLDARSGGGGGGFEARRGGLDARGASGGGGGGGGFEARRGGGGGGGGGFEASGGGGGGGGFEARRGGGGGGAFQTGAALASTAGAAPSTTSCVGAGAT
jgi:hypothetical protein